MSRDRPIVLVLEQTQSNIDVSSAAEFGELTYLLRRDTPRCSVFDTARYEQLVRSRLLELNYDPLKDTVCLAGKIICICALCALIAREYGVFNVALFDAHENRYVRRKLGEIK